MIRDPEEGSNVDAISPTLYARSQYLNTLSDKEVEIFFKGWDFCLEHYRDALEELASFRKNAINSKEIIKNHYDKKFADQNKTS